MLPAVVAFAGVEELAGFVHAVLCEKDALDPAQTPLFRTPLKKAGRVCGLVFHVEGPRLLKTSAVWSADDDRIILYDSSGVRFRDVRLSESPSHGLPIVLYDPSCRGAQSYVELAREVTHSDSTARAAQPARGEKEREVGR